METASVKLPIQHELLLPVLQRRLDDPRIAIVMAVADLSL
jgi:hypothetical protein